MESRIAILIPCYKSESTIVETLQSIQSQTGGLERVAYIILADDKSPDATVQRAIEYWGERHPPLKHEQRQRNHGEYLSVNLAVAGLDPDIEWFLIMHGDNIAEQDYVELLLKHIDRADRKTALICGSWRNFNDRGFTGSGDDRYQAHGSEIIEGTDAAVASTLEKGCWWHISCTAIRVSAYKAVGGLPRGMRQKGDFDFLLRILAFGHAIEYIPKPLMQYREHQGSMSSANFSIHRDIAETLFIARYFAYALPFGRLVCWYARVLVVMVRRLAASIVRGHWQRARLAIVVGCQLFGEACSAAARRLTNSEPRRERFDYESQLPEGEVPTTFVAVNQSVQHPWMVGSS